MKTPEAAASESVLLTVFLSVAAVVTASGLRLFIAPRFVAMFADFGDEVPWVTRQFSTGWLGPALTLGLGLGCVGLSRRSAVGAVVAASVLITGTIAAFLAAMYLPIFELAGRLK